MTNFLHVCRFLLVTCVLGSGPHVTFAQDEPANSAEGAISIGDGSGKIIIETQGKRPEPPPFFKATVDAETKITEVAINQTFKVLIRVIQGNPKSVSLELRGSAEIDNVQGEAIQSWGVRRNGDSRFLDLYLSEGAKEVQASVQSSFNITDLPKQIDLGHLAPGDAVGFASTMSVEFASDIQGNVQAVDGFAALEPLENNLRFQSTTGGRIAIDVSRDAAAPSDVEFIDAILDGSMHSNNRSVAFQFKCTAKVIESSAEIVVLSGNAAMSTLPENGNYKLRLEMIDNRPVYKLVFPQPGTFDVDLEFVAPIISGEDNRSRIDFTVATSAIVPMTVKGFDSDLTFLQTVDSIIPRLSENAWTGFLPANGHALLEWKSVQKTGEGKLFFTTSGRVEAQLGTGLLRQDHTIQYQVLQGELTTLSIELNGAGEILDVQGDKVLAWTIGQEEQRRTLEISLSQPITTTDSIVVRSQNALDAFPVRVEGLSLNPTGSIRHAGFLRLSNFGLVRIEPVDLTGLAQLSPDQFPGDPLEARQVYVYRFPAAEHSFTVIADRVQPEVNISELTEYQLTETDRRITADIELDIREAPIREWDFSIPEDYSVVSVTGASVADYVVGTTATEGRKNLKVVFSQDVQGRQLVTLNLEKSETAAAGQWQLQRISYPNAKTVRGDIGVLGTPGFRLMVVETGLLLEKPVSYFPKSSPYLQQAFRIREPEWSATLQIELLDRSVQADVFHLYSLSEQTVFGSALINYFVTGSPVAEWTVTVPENLGNVTVDGQDVRTWRREGDNLIVTLHQGVMGAYTLLITYEEKPDDNTGIFSAGQIVPTGIQGERGFVQIVSPLQVELSTVVITDEMLKLDALELPAEFRLLTSAPPLGTWQYTERPFQLDLHVKWFKPGSTVTQVIEFSEANSRVSKDGELVTDVLYYIKSRGERTLRLELPGEPVRLWAVAVNGQPVTARRADDETLIPLPGEADPNIPVEVSLRLGKPAATENRVEISLPVLPVPVLKTQWNIVGDEKHVLVPSGGSVSPAEPALRPTGWEWVGRRGVLMMGVIGLLTVLGVWGSKRPGLFRLLGLVSLAGATWIACVTAIAAYDDIEGFDPLQLNVPVLAAGESLIMEVENVDLWRVYVSWPGVAAMIIGLILLLGSFTKAGTRTKTVLRSTGLLVLAGGSLMQRDAAAWFFATISLGLLICLLIPATWNWLGLVWNWFSRVWRRRSVPSTTIADGSATGQEFAAVTSAIIFCFGLSISQYGLASDNDGIPAAEQITQSWQISDLENRLIANGQITLSGKPGDRFILLASPAVLTRFEGDGLRLSKFKGAGDSLSYIVTIQQPELSSENPTDAGDEVVEESASESDLPATKVDTYQATFEYVIDSVNPLAGIPVLTGSAAVKKLTISYNRPGLDIICAEAVRIESASTADITGAELLLGPGGATVRMKPLSRDISSEATQYYVESANLFIPGPGVVDGMHRIRIRTSRGQVGSFEITVPQGLTVSTVSGPIGSWQFDADSGRLTVAIEPKQTDAFDVFVTTQRGLDPLPVAVELAPLRVPGAAGEVGLLAIAFGPEAQPETIDARNMSVVNLGDFDASLLENKSAVLHRVFRYGKDDGLVNVMVTPVSPDVRVYSKQVLSLGDERVVLALNVAVEISRAGLFQLSFPLPVGLEIESLTGPALHHWSEVAENGQRQIVLHLNGKTLGIHEFALTLAGNTPTELSEWQIPQLRIDQATRQTGELVVRPTTGIRLRTMSRQNVSETDPRTIGGQSQGALAFRLLQQDWSLTLGIERLDSWITGQVLHDVTLREGQTRTVLAASFNIENASIRSLQVILPTLDADVIKTLRATGDVVSDLVRTEPESSIWEVRFKRRVIGKVEFGIEYEKRGVRENDSERFMPAGFPEARQLTYHFGVRAGGRLELDHDVLSEGWQRVDWNTVATNLRQSISRTAPVFTVRAVSPIEPLVIRARRHALADALKLRIAKASLTTVLSPTGDQLTAVESIIEITQRSSLTVSLPDNGELFSIFVNGESVNSIRLDSTQPVWQFNILPGMDERTAELRFVYSVPGEQLNDIVLRSPEMNVPMENIQWDLVAPSGYKLTDHDGDLELRNKSVQQEYDRDSYLSKVFSKRKSQALEAEQLLEQANQLLQAGEQSKARWALNSVANQYALDAASNEDARVQLENLQTQQAVVGLNTRRQRLMLDNSPGEAFVMQNDQLRAAAAQNPILQQEELNYRPQQMSQLLGGNTSEDNAVLQQIAYRLVQHQHSTDPAPQAILISLPEGGSIYTFVRAVQVAENAPLQLKLQFDLSKRLRVWQIALTIVTLLAISLAFTLFSVRNKRHVESETGSEPAASLSSQA